MTLENLKSLIEASALHNALAQAMSCELPLVLQSGMWNQRSGKARARGTSEANVAVEGALHLSEHPARWLLCGTVAAEGVTRRSVAIAKDEPRLKIRHPSQGQVS